MKNTLSAYLFVILLILNYSQPLYGQSAINDQQEQIANLESNKDLQSMNSKDIIIKALGLYKSSDLEQADSLLSKFLMLRPYSAYKDIAIYYQAIIWIEEKEIDKSIESLTSLVNSRNNRIKNSSVSLLKKIINRRLSKLELKKLKEEINLPEIQNIIEAKFKSIHALVVLPITGSDSQYGKAILDGIKFYLNKNSSTDWFSYDILDSRSNTGYLVKQASRYLKNNSYDIVIGELSTESTIALAGVTSSQKIPLIAPTASQNEYLTTINENIYQLATSSYTMGKQIANYAIKELNCKFFATLSPISEESNQAFKGFSETVIENGCEIFAQEWYYEPENLNKQLKYIRENALMVDSLNIKTYMHDDSIDTYPIDLIDAFFIPLRDKDIDYIPKQLAFYNFQTKLLGTFGWNDKDRLYKVEQNIDSLIFITQDKNIKYDNKIVDFINNYRMKTSRTASNLEMLGYDTMELIKLAYEKHGNLEKGLNNIQYAGILGSYDFSNSHINTATNLNLYMRKNGISKIKRSSNDDINKIDSLAYFKNRYQITYRKHNYKNALKILKKITTIDNDKENYNFAFANLYHLTANYQLSNEYLDKIIKEAFPESQTSKQARLLKAKNIYSLSDFKESALLLEQLYNENWDPNGETSLLLYKIYSDIGNLNKSKYWLEISAMQNNKKAMKIIKLENQ